MFKLLFCKDGFLKKQTNNKKKSACKLFHFGTEALQSSATSCDAALRTSAAELLPAHSPRLLGVQIQQRHPSHPPALCFPPSLTPWDAGECLPYLAAGTSHSPLSVAWGGGCGAEFFTCGWFSVISIFQPESPTLPLEKNDHW